MGTRENTWSGTRDLGPVRTHSAVLPGSTATSFHGSGPRFGCTDGGAPHLGDADGLGPGLLPPWFPGHPGQIVVLHTRSRHTHLKCPMPRMLARCQDAKNQWQPTVAFESGSSHAAPDAWSHINIPEHRKGSEMTGQRALPPPLITTWFSSSDQRPRQRVPSYWDGMSSK